MNMKNHFVPQIHEANASNTTVSKLYKLCDVAATQQELRGVIGISNPPEGKLSRIKSWLFKK